MKDKSIRNVLELGIGDGCFLVNLAEREKQPSNCFYIGIEKGNDFFKTKDLFNLPNVLVIQDDFEIIIEVLPDRFFDQIYFILPDYIYIDRYYEKHWTNFYKILKSKIRYDGRFLLITELTDPLLNPLSSNDFEEWSNWLLSTFKGIGFLLKGYHKEVPRCYTSKCIEFFKQDKQRIKMITLEFTV